MILMRWPCLCSKWDAICAHGVAKAMVSRGFCLFTNYDGRKGGELLQPGKGCICDALEIIASASRVTGHVSPVQLA